MASIGRPGAALVAAACAALAAEPARPTPSAPMPTPLVAPQPDQPDSTSPPPAPAVSPAAAAAAFDALAATLKLTPAQAAAFADYVAAIKGAVAAQAAAPSADQFRAMTMPDRLDYIAARVAADLKLAQDQARAARRFYALLGAEQRKAFDEATAPATHEQRATLAAPAQPPRDTPDYTLPSHVNPDWLVRPTPEEIARVYPSAASARGVGGRAVLTCTVDVDGYAADCVVDSETPPGEGFGNAALEITAYMRFRPMTDYGVPHPAKITLPINFDPNTAAKPTGAPQ